jgi:hypothetical protein
MEASIPTSEYQQTAGSAGGETPRQGSRVAHHQMMAPPFRSSNTGPHKIGAAAAADSVQLAHKGYFKSTYLRSIDRSL